MLKDSQPSGRPQQGRHEMETIAQERDRGYELSEELTHVVGCKIDLEHQETGGGNTALRLDLNDGRYLMITSTDCDQVPDYDAPLMVGWYRPSVDEAYYLLEFESDDRFIMFADWASTMFISGNPMLARSWGSALDASLATVHVYPNADDRFWAPA